MIAAATLFAGLPERPLPEAKVKFFGTSIYAMAIPQTGPAEEDEYLS